MDPEINSHLAQESTLEELRDLVVPRKPVAKTRELSLATVQAVPFSSKSAPTWELAAWDPLKWAKWEHLVTSVRPHVCRGQSLC